MNPGDAATTVMTLPDTQEEILVRALRVGLRIGVASHGSLERPKPREPGHCRPAGWAGRERRDDGALAGGEPRRRQISECRIDVVGQDRKAEIELRE
jgi:hypothetical protein